MPVELHERNGLCFSKALWLWWENQSKNDKQKLSPENILLTFLACALLGKGPGEQLSLLVEISGIFIYNEILIWWRELHI